MTLVPRTRSGRWGVGLTLAGVLAFGAMAIVTATPLPGYLGLTAGGVVSLVAVLHRGERSYATAASLALGVAAVATLAWIAVAESL